MRRVAVAVLLALVPVLFVVPLANADPSMDADDWYLEAMKVTQAHDLSEGSDVTVAVIDTGVDPGRPELVGRVLPGALITEDGPKPGSSFDEDGHGTAMAGLIAGAETSDNPAIGVAPKATIMPVKIERDPNGTLDHRLVYEGVRWAIDHGAAVVNLSLAGRPTEDDAWKSELVEYALANDVVIVAAVGNRSVAEAAVGEPASIPGVVAVSGMARDGSIWSGSATGDEVVLCAPAQDLPHLDGSDDVRLASGTSAATALVSGSAALIRSAFPDASAAEVVSRLVDSATDAGEKGRDPSYGFGTVNAHAALTTSVQPGARYPLDLLEDDVETAVADLSELGGWWLAVPAIVAAVAGMGAFYWLVRRARGRQLVPVEESA